MISPGKDGRVRSSFDGVHIFTPHADVPDDSALRLILLAPEQCYSREETRMATEGVLDYVRNNGSKPRYRGNRLMFLAPDHGAVSRLRDAVRVALAWGSIVDDVNESRLNIDLLQKNQAEKELRTSEDVLPKVARECYRWLLCPVQNSPTECKPTVEVFPINTAGSGLGNEIERVCADNELIITAWSPIHLRTKLKELYWKTDKPGIGAMLFWEDTMRYLYLPRLRSRDVLAQVVVKGAGSRDFFGTAYGQSEAKFDGFKLGDSNVQLDDTLLLIEPGAAVLYEAQMNAEIAKAAAGIAAVASPSATSPSPVATPTAGAGETEHATAPAPVKAKAFHGSIEVKPAGAKLRLVELAEEIISVLASDPQAELKITLEINAEFPTGVSDQIKRTVSENATNLGFKIKSWE